MYELIGRLTVENEKLNRENSKLKEEVKLLNAKLKESYEMDITAMNNELKALKRNIADGLMYDYNGFMGSSTECNEDNFMANYGALSRIFQTLDRLGINFNCR